MRAMASTQLAVSYIKSSQCLACCGMPQEHAWHASGLLLAHDPLQMPALQTVHFQHRMPMWLDEENVWVFTDKSDLMHLLEQLNVSCMTDTVLGSSCTVGMLGGTPQPSLQHSAARSFAYSLPYDSVPVRFILHS